MGVRMVMTEAGRAVDTGPLNQQLGREAVPLDVRAGLGSQGLEPSVGKAPQHRAVEAVVGITEEGVDRVAVAAVRVSSIPAARRSRLPVDRALMTAA